MPRRNANVDRSRRQAPTVGAAYVAAVRADHLAHCADCRAVDAEIEARAVENAASIARRDRRQLGLDCRVMRVLESA